MALDPKPLPTQLGLVRANLECQDWAETIRTAGVLIAADPKHRYLEAYLDEAIARYHLRDMDGAEARVKELLQLDKAHQVPRAEYVLGMILEARKDIAAAREHMQKYLACSRGPPTRRPRGRASRTWARGRPAVRTTKSTRPNLTVANPGETSVPGGLKAFAMIAHMENEPTYENFFLDYCRRLLQDASPYAEDHIPVYGGQLRAYMAAVDELAAAGTAARREYRIGHIVYEGATEAQGTARLLRQFGWTLDATGESPKIELGDQPADGLRHRIPAALGIDEIAMRDALEAGRNFQFEIHTDNARLVGGIRWAAALKTVPPFPGGMAEVFSQDLRFTKAYAGLGAMSVDTALGLISTVGVRALVTQYADVLALCSSAFTVSGGRASTPGGTAAQPVWAKLAGADPAKPATLFRALLTKDGGRLAVFYSVLSQADEKRQRYFTSDAARVAAILRMVPGFHRDAVYHGPAAAELAPGLLGKIPLDDSGRVRFPGGREAWSSSSGTDDDVTPEIRVDGCPGPGGGPGREAGGAARCRVGQASGAPLRRMEVPVPLLREAPGAGRAEFQALAAFTEAASDQPLEARNTSGGRVALAGEADRAGRAGRIPGQGSGGARVRASVHRSDGPGSIAQRPGGAAGDRRRPGQRG